MNQSRRMSLVEQFTNTSAGILMDLATWTFIIEPLFGISKPMSQSIQITLIFTVVSFLRGYGCRRLFNYLQEKKH